MDNPHDGHSFDTSSFSSSRVAEEPIGAEQRTGDGGGEMTRVHMQTEHVSESAAVPVRRSSLSRIFAILLCK